MHSNKYITIYTLIMTLIVSVVLAFVVTGLKPMHDSNEAVFKKKEILGAIKDQIGQDISKLKDKAVLDLFNANVEQVVISADGKILEGEKAENVDMAAEEKKPEAERKYPLFKYKTESGPIYLMAVRGNGLWDKIWGFVALKDDLKTVVGMSFGHVAETPGLGAEIKDNPNFAKQFEGKSILNDKGEYTSVAVVKGGVHNPSHEVDGISGATITSRGVSEMLYKGLQAYLKYFETLKEK